MAQARDRGSYRELRRHQRALLSRRDADREGSRWIAKIFANTTIDLTDQDGTAEEQRFAEAAGLKFFKIAMTTRVPPTAEQARSS